MTETFVYESKTGNLKSHIDFNTQTASFSYDQGNDRLLLATYADGRVEKFTYSVTGNRQTVTTPLGTTSYSYDNRSRLVKEIKPNNVVLEYGYDNMGNRTLLILTLPDDTFAQVQYQYDALNRLQKVIAPEGETTYSYDSVGNRGQVVYPNGTASLYAYDPLNRLISLETRKPDNRLLASYQYTLAPTGHRTQVSEHTGRVVSYLYDDLYRLTEEKIMVGGNETVFSYQYDVVGNRVYSIEDGVHTQYTYDANDRLLKQGGVTYQYDKNGNTIRIEEELNVVRMGYDGENRLISVVTEDRSQVTSTVKYAYDADGNRVQTNVDGEISHHVVDSNDMMAQVIAELDQNGQINVAYLHGDDLISQYRGNDIHYYHYDGLGSTRALTDQNATVTDTYGYEAFGELQEQTGETDNNYLYTGEQFDPNTGNYYLRARFYNPASGRFLSMDSFDGLAQEPMTLHKYLYANADPVNMVDPSGYFSLGSLSAGNSVSSILSTMSRINKFMDILDVALNPDAGSMSDFSFGTLVLTGMGGGKIAKIFSKKLKKKLRKRKKRKRTCKNRNSFTGETLVHVREGLVPIKDLEIGDEVLSYDESKQENYYRPVTHLIQAEAKHTVILMTLENGEGVESTAGHSFSVYNHQGWAWRNAEEITVEDILYLKGKKFTTVQSLERTEKYTQVYNLSVADTHTYYIQKSGVLVHNEDCDTTLFRGPQRGDIGPDGQPSLDKGEFYSTEALIAAKYAHSYGTGILMITMSQSDFDSLLKKGHIVPDPNLEKASFQVINRTAFNKAVKQRDFVKSGTIEMFQLIQDYGLPFFH